MKKKLRRKSVKTKQKVGDANLVKKGAPDQADGYQEVELDPKKKKEGEEDLYNTRKFSTNNTKNEAIGININMKKKSNKSLFNSIVEQVLGEDFDELDALGIEDDGDEDMGMEDDGLEDEVEEVTVTLSPEQADCLRAIVDQLGGGEEEFEDEDGGEELDLDDEGEDDDMGFGEEVDAEYEGHPLVNQKKGNPKQPTAGDNKVSKISAKSSKGGDPKVTDEVGTDEDEGHPLVNQKKGNPKKPTAGDNKVKSSVTNQANKEFFQ